MSKFSICACGRPMFFKVLKRDDYEKEIKKGLLNLASTELELVEKLDHYNF